MPDPPSHSTPKDPRDEEFSDFIEKGEDTSGPIRVPPPCINANRLSQTITGPGRKKTRTSGNQSLSGSGSISFTSTGVRPPTVSACLNGSPILARPAWNWYVSTTKSSPHATTHRRTRFPGKTLFLDFMLARLISAKQIVLVYTASYVLLFYHGTVYTRRPADFSGVPRHRKHPFFFAWALIDADSSIQQPPICNLHYIWPIQASSPQPTRWQGWSKQRKAFVWGMPLWNMKELMQAYVLSAPCHLSTMSFSRRSSLTALRFAAYLFVRNTITSEPR